MALFQPQAPFFAALPTEIRLKIYKLYLVFHPSDLVHFVNWNDLPRRHEVPPLARTCRRAADEIHAQMVSRVSFRLEVPHPSERNWPLFFGDLRLGCAAHGTLSWPRVREAHLVVQVNLCHWPAFLCLLRLIA